MTKLLVAWMLFVATAFLVAQAQPQDSANATKPSAAYTGMYSFLRDGEFVQVSVEDTGKVNGFVSRYGDLDSDRGAFLDQFFKEGKLEGKNPGDEAYYVLKGTLTEHVIDVNRKTTSRAREVVFKAFPQDDAPAAGGRK